MQQSSGPEQKGESNRTGYPAPPDDDETLPQKTTGGVIWSFLAQAVNKGFTLITIAILSRLLLKSDFGLLAIATMTLNYLALFKDLGLGAALIQRDQDIDRAASTVFTLNCLLGISLTAGTFLLAPLVASYFGEKEIIPILQVLGFTFIINALGSVHILLLRKRMEFRKKVIPDIGNALTKGVVSIALALTGFGIWSLVIGQLAGITVALVLAWLVMPWKPRLNIDFPLAKSLMNFGLIVMATETLYVISSNLPMIIVGKIFGMALLGVFSMAYRLPEVLIIGNLWILAGVLFPLFSLLQSQPDRLSSGFLTSIRFVTIFSTPICFGLIVAADPLIRVLYGPQWLDAIPVLRVLAAYAWVHSIGYHAGDVYKALGRPKVVFYLCALSVPVELTAMLAGARFGLTGIGAGLLAAVLIQAGLNLLVAVFLVKVSAAEIAGAIKPALLSGGMLLLAAVPVHLLGLGTSPLSELFALVLFCGIAYTVTLWLADRPNLLRVYALLFKSRQKTSIFAE